MLNDILLIFSDYTLRTVAAGSAILGILSGVLGAFAVLRKQSLLGDAISHAALPGIALAFIIFRSKSLIVLVLGAAIAGWLGTLFISLIVRRSRIKDDSALGLILSVFFGFGLVLMTYIQKMSSASQAGLDKFLFGQAATLLQEDVITMGLISVVAIIILVIFWKEFKILSFDREFGASLGFPMHVIDMLMTTLLVFAIVIGLQTVGVVLMSAMVVVPAAAARQWTNRLGIMIFLSGFFGALAGINGAILSSIISSLPTGPTIVICISFIFFFSLFFAPNRGLVWRYLLNIKNQNKLQVEAVLIDFYYLAKQHEFSDHGHPVPVLKTMSVGHGGVKKSLSVLRSRGWISENNPGYWSITEAGIVEAEKLSESLGGGK